LKGRKRAGKNRTTENKTGKRNVCFRGTRLEGTITSEWIAQNKTGACVFAVANKNPQKQSYEAPLGVFHGSL